MRPCPFQSLNSDDGIDCYDLYPLIPALKRQEEDGSLGWRLAWSTEGILVQLRPHRETLS